MNEKLKNLTEQPDGAVWEGVERSLARRRVARRVRWAAVCVVAVGAAVVVAFPREEQPSGEPPVVLSAVAYDEAVSAQPTVAVRQEAAQEAAASPSVRRAEGEVVAIGEEWNEPEAREEEPSLVARGDVAVRPVVEASVSDTEFQVSGSKFQVSGSKAEVETASVAEASAPAGIPDPSPAKSPSSGGVSNVPDMLLWFPNVFMPSSDNDELNRFRAQLNKEDAMVKDFRMAVYSRAGARVFFSTDMNEVWDGTRDGQPLPQAAYVYVAFYTDGDGVQHHCKGTVTLVR